MGTPVAELLELLDLEALGDDCFRAPGVVTERSRLYGGQLVAQAMMAAGRVAEPDRSLHAVHASFLSGGSATEAIDYEVHRLRDSGSFTVCSVRAEQHGRALLQLTASFHLGEVGPEVDVGGPTVGAPETMISVDDWLLAQPDPATQVDLPYFVDAAEFRQASDAVVRDEATGRGSLPGPQRDVWVRVVDRLPDRPLVHACVIAYLSDKPALGTTVLGPPLHGDPSGHLVASLDHAMWFHRSCRADEWMLFHCETATAAGARAFARMELYGGDGRLAVSAAQEGLIRPLRP